jgi:uncharacterized membrane protein
MPSLPRRAFENRLYALPLLGLVAGFALSLLTLAIDRSHHGLVPSSITGAASSAQSLFQLIAQSVLTLTSLLLSLTLVAIQLAMGQFSPRIVRALLTDRRSQGTLALLLATFAVAFMGLRAVKSGGPGGGYVPGVTAVVAYGLAIASIAMLLVFVHAAGQALRVSGLVDLVGNETHGQLERLYPDELPGATPEAASERVFLAPRAGAVTAVDRTRLVGAAQRAGCVIEMLPAMGDFVCEGAPLLRIHGDASRLQEKEVVRRVELAAERTHYRDPAYGIRKLVDIAERSIAQPFDDPTTTVQAVDRIHDCLRLLARRNFGDGRFRDEEGEVRLVVPAMGWDGFVRLAFDELRLAGAASPQVARRLRAVLVDLRHVAPPERRPPLEHQLALLDAGVRRSYDDEDDVRAGLVADEQGIGSGPDLVTTRVPAADRAGRLHTPALPGAPPPRDGRRR